MSPTILTTLGAAGDQAAQTTKAGAGPKAAVEVPKAAEEAEAVCQMRLAALRAEAARLEAPEDLPQCRGPIRHRHTKRRANVIFCYLQFLAALWFF